MYVIVTVNIGIALYFIFSPRDKTPSVGSIHPAAPAPVITKEPDREAEMPTPAKENEKPATIISVPAREVNPEPEKTTITVSKKPTVNNTPDVVPPDESDAGLLSGVKSVKPAVKKIASKNDDDILEDNGAANGFNTGIKKDSIKNKH